MSMPVISMPCNPITMCQTASTDSTNTGGEMSK